MSDPHNGVWRAHMPPTGWITVAELARRSGQSVDEIWCSPEASRDTLDNAEKAYEVVIHRHGATAGDPTAAYVHTYPAPARCAACPVGGEAPASPVQVRPGKQPFPSWAPARARLLRVLRDASRFAVHRRQVNPAFASTRWVRADWICQDAGHPFEARFIRGDVASTIGNLFRRLSELPEVTVHRHAASDGPRAAEWWATVAPPRDRCPACPSPPPPDWNDPTEWLIGTEDVPLLDDLRPPGMTRRPWYRQRLGDEEPPDILPDEREGTDDDDAWNDDEDPFAFDS